MPLPLPFGVGQPTMPSEFVTPLRRLQASRSDPAALLQSVLSDRFSVPLTPRPIRYSDMCGHVAGSFFGLKYSSAGTFCAVPYPPVTLQNVPAEEYFNPKNDP